MGADEGRPTHHTQTTSKWYRKATTISVRQLLNDLLMTFWASCPQCELLLKPIGIRSKIIALDWNGLDGLIQSNKSLLVCQRSWPTRYRAHTTPPTHLEFNDPYGFVMGFSHIAYTDPGKSCYIISVSMHDTMQKKRPAKNLIFQHKQKINTCNGGRALGNYPDTFVFNKICSDTFVDTSFDTFRKNRKVLFLTLLNRLTWVHREYRG